MAAATTAMAAKNAAEDIAKNGASINGSLMAGHWEAEQTQAAASTTHSGSTLAAGNNVAIIATESGKDSSITVVGRRSRQTTRSTCWQRKTSRASIARAKA